MLGDTQVTSVVFESDEWCDETMIIRDERLKAWELNLRFQKCREETNSSRLENNKSGKR
jgi:hypothetical protein